MKSLSVRSLFSLLLGLALASLAIGLIIWQKQRIPLPVYFKVEVKAMQIPTSLRQKFRKLADSGIPAEILQFPNVTILMSPASTVENNGQARFVSEQEFYYPTEFERQGKTPYPTMTESRLIGWTLTMRLQQRENKVFLVYKYENLQYLGSEELPPKGNGIQMPQFRTLTGENFSALIPFNQDVVLFTAEPPPEVGTQIKTGSYFVALIAKVNSEKR
jgi:hypothetical protein